MVELAIESTAVKMLILTRKVMDVYHMIRFSLTVTTDSTFYQMVDASTAQSTTEGSEKIHGNATE